MTLWELLRQKYPPASYALFSEVGNATGSTTKRHADAVCVSLWPSRGLEVIGFELKASRGDWKRELEDPEKAEAVCKYCDRWYVVAHGKDIVKREELPKTWGLMVAADDKLRTVVEAPLLEPLPLDRKFVASMARAAQKQVEAEVAKAKQPGEDQRWQLKQTIREELNADHVKAVERAREDERRRWDDIRAAIKDFEQKSGLNMFGMLGQTWKIGRIAEAVKFLAGDYDPAKRVALIAKEMRELADAGDRAVAELRASGITEAA